MPEAQLAVTYRRLLRAGLQAIRYSRPARYALLNTLRKSFRHSHPADYCPAKISRTVEFLQNAAKDRGIEHKIVRNILMVRYWQDRMETKIRPNYPVEWNSSLRRSGHENFEDTLKLLNETIGTCLK